MMRTALLFTALLLPIGVGAQTPPPVPVPAPIPVPERQLPWLHLDLLRLRDIELRPFEVPALDFAPFAVLAPLSWSFEIQLPEAGDPQDPADGLYRQAREALNRNQYTRAVELFAQIRARHPRSAYVQDSFFWEAFAQHRRGAADGMRLALELLEQQRTRYPDASTLAEARTLEIRIQSDLARRGDAASAAALAERAAQIAPPRPPVGAPPVPQGPRNRASTSLRCGDDDEERVAALNALMQMDVERAMPILERVLARRDAESVCLRRRAMFIVSQQRSDRMEAILLNAARSDPDTEVRQQAIFWLGQSGSPRAATALDSILRTSTDVDVQKRVLFSLAQMNRPNTAAMLRTYAGRSDAHREVRDQAIFWLGQSGNAENASFLQDLYGRERDEQLKERILFAVSQMPRQSNADYGRWLVTIAGNASESVKLRKNAIFWAGQSGVPLTELIQAYDRIPEREMKEQVIFVLSQRNEREAADKLLAIARTDRDPQLKQRAMFWLTQRNDPRVADLLVEILERRN